MSFMFFDIVSVVHFVTLKNDIKRGIEREGGRERERIMVIKRVQKIATQS